MTIRASAITNLLTTSAGTAWSRFCRKWSRGKLFFFLRFSPGEKDGNCYVTPWRSVNKSTYERDLQWIWREIASRIRLHLRGCVKVSSRCETVENKACCSDVDRRLRSLHAVLVVLTQASIAAKPSEAALCNPGEACDLGHTLLTFDDL